MAKEAGISEHSVLRIWRAFGLKPIGWTQDHSPGKLLFGATFLKLTSLAGHLGDALESLVSRACRAGLTARNRKRPW